MNNAKKENTARVRKYKTGISSREPTYKCTDIHTYINTCTRVLYFCMLDANHQSLRPTETHMYIQTVYTYVHISAYMYTMLCLPAPRS